MARRGSEIDEDAKGRVQVHSLFVLVSVFVFFVPAGPVGRFCLFIFPPN